jgi:hypothetical protein
MLDAQPFPSVNGTTNRGATPGHIASVTPRDDSALMRTIAESFPMSGLSAIPGSQTLRRIAHQPDWAHGLLMRAVQLKEHALRANGGPWVDLTRVAASGMTAICANATPYPSGVDVNRPLRIATASVAGGTASGRGPPRPGGQVPPLKGRPHRSRRRVRKSA